MRKIACTIFINTTPFQVITAFTEFALLQKWWGVERALIEPRPGGIYNLAWKISPSGFGFVSTGIIREYRPEGLLRIEDFIYMNPSRPTLGPMSLVIEARNFQKGTECYLCQDGYGAGPDWDWYYNIVKEAWPVVLGGLKNFLEGKGL